MNARSIYRIARETIRAWIDDRAPSMGAALSYYTVFSVAPLLLIVIGVVGLVFGSDAAQAAVVGQLQQLLGEQVGDTVAALLDSLQRPREGGVAAAIGFGALLVGATSVFAELQDDLDRIFEAPERPRAEGLWGWLRTRLLSLGMVLTTGFLLLVSLLASTALAALGGWLGGSLEGWQIVLRLLELTLGYAVITVMFALIYRFMPQQRTPWRAALIGAAFTALLFTVGKYLIGLYLGRTSVTSGFGAAGSLAVLLVWVYYSAQIFLLGAEFTWVYSRHAAVPETPARPATAAAGTLSSPKPAFSTPVVLPLEPMALPAAGGVVQRVGLGFGVGAVLAGLLWLIAAQHRQPIAHQPGDR